VLSVQEVVKRWLYVRLVGWLRDGLGASVHYRQRYREYLNGPRWLVLRSLRVWWDGWECVDCGSRVGLQVHHVSYAHKGKGLGLGEWLDLRTVCDACHRKRHGIGWKRAIPKVWRPPGSLFTKSRNSDPARGRRCLCWDHTRFVE
jgi:5-methylcytosine-specific restriction endonuclease McrA